LANGIDPMWQDTSGHKLIDDPANVEATGTFETPANDILGAAISLIDPLPPPVPSNTLAVATVDFKKVGAKSPVYQRLWSKSAGLPDDWAGLDIAATGAVLSNTWAANASGGTKAMVAASVLTRQAFGAAVGSATWVLPLWDPLVPRPDMGRIAVDVVPPDRLK
jgi:hypothetical protein